MIASIDKSYAQAHNRQMRRKPKLDKRGLIVRSAWEPGPARFKRAKANKGRKLQGEELAQRMQELADDALAHHYEPFVYEQ